MDVCVFFLIVSPCEVYPCKNGGICSNEKDGGFKCACRNGYGGQLCNKKGMFSIPLGAANSAKRGKTFPCGRFSFIDL